MSTNEARDLVSRYIEMVWNRGDLAAFQNLTTESFTYQIGGQPGRNRLEMPQFKKIL